MSIQEFDNLAKLRVDQFGDCALHGVTRDASELLSEVAETALHVGAGGAPELGEPPLD